MKNRFAPRKSVPSFAMFSTIIIAVSIPILVLGLSGETTFDIRNQAYETASPTSSNPCVIYLPKVNPLTLEKDGSYKVSVEAISDIKDIEGVTLLDEDGKTLFEKKFTTLTNSVEETFTYTPTENGDDFIRGTLEKVGDDIACSGVPIKVIEKNTKPSVTSSTENFNLTNGDEYEYTLTAEDPDGDIVNYFYSFTPNADWLKAVVVEDGTSGKIKITLKGTPTEPASYLLHIFAHDGYSNHLTSVGWIINVSQGENDIPVVEILDPSDVIAVNKGETIYTKWLASDLNQITKYQLYISQDPSDTDTWIAVDENISYRNREYTVNTSSISAGVYQLIVRAVDNQDPSGIGFDISPTITIKGEEEETNDDIVLLEPQIINMTPNNASVVENTQPIIRATLVAGTNATINQKSILLKINDREITEDVRLNEISESEITLIYQPSESLSSGIQKIDISFTDSNGDTAEKSWTFTISDTGEDTNDDNTLNIFGITIGKKVALIIGAGMIVMILAILIPILIYKIWSKDETEESNKNLPPKVPSVKTNMFDVEQYEVKQKKKIPEETESVPTPVSASFSTPSLEDMEKEESEKIEERKEIPMESKSEVEENTNNTAWKPKIQESENTEQLTSQSTVDTPSTTIHEDIQQTVLPDLDIPSPEIFTSPVQPTDIPAPETDTKTIDDISRLYEEIQKVENTDNMNTQNQIPQNENS